MQPQLLIPTPPVEQFCQMVKDATGHECRPYRAGVFCMSAKSSERIVTFHCNDIAPDQFPMVLERIIKPATSSLYA